MEDGDEVEDDSKDEIKKLFKKTSINLHHRGYEKTWNVNLNAKRDGFGPMETPLKKHALFTLHLMVVREWKKKKKSYTLVQLPTLTVLIFIFVSI